MHLKSENQLSGHSTPLLNPTLARICPFICERWRRG